MSTNFLLSLTLWTLLIVGFPLMLLAHCAIGVP
jgi:hypothetical protein